MPVIFLPDGSRREYQHPVSIADVAADIGLGLAKAALAGKVGGRMVDLSHIIHQDIDLAIVTARDEDALELIRHDAAHVMAQAVQELYPGTQVTIGPAIEDGFYYDFARSEPFTPADLEKIEERMHEIVGRDLPIQREVWDRDQAKQAFRGIGENYKVEIIEDIIPIGEDVSIYRQGDWFDVCRGPHLPSTGKLPKAFKLMKLAGAYWRGDSKNAMLQRIYGTAWRDKKELQAYLARLEEAEKRDHRKIGKQLELFHFDPTAPGMPYWLPHGVILLNTLIDFWRTEHAARGYQEIMSPLINNKSLWETSGHWDHYKEDMYVVGAADTDATDRENGCETCDHDVFAIKPMNCPNAMVVFNLGIRSHRDLPLRLSDCDPLHRNEASGTLHGLLRVRSFRQDDAHIFVRESQIEDEYDRILEICDLFYSIFGMSYQFRLGTRPASFIGDEQTWEEAEAALRRILDQRVGSGKYIVAEGDGAFYGPKIDILMTDAIGRTWQMGTVQLDFQLPRRFNCRYVDENGQFQTPVVIHRVIYGSLERFIGILIEHTAGAFPFWLSPIQAVLVPIADRHLDYCHDVAARLRRAGFRVEVDAGNERMNAKVRNAEMNRIPYILVAGDAEQNNDTVALRLRSGGNLGITAVDALIDRMAQVQADKADH